jgi:transcriptional regulator with GAF, ATPase, and Fis domain
MTRRVEEVHKIRSSDVTVLVTGESGTGKEMPRSEPRLSNTLLRHYQRLITLDSTEARN